MVLFIDHDAAYLFPVYQAVSYTHLDVYKRQGYPLLGEMNVVMSYHHGGLVSYRRSIFDLLYSSGDEAVSYTHLDVYKRQIPRRAPNWNS